MENRIDAERAINTLVELWAYQYGQRITGVKVTRRGSNEKVNNSVDNIASGY